MRLLLSKQESRSNCVQIKNASSNSFELLDVSIEWR